MSFVGFEWINKSNSHLCVFSRIQKNSSTDKIGDASNPSHCNGVKNGGDDDDHSSADPSSDEEADENGLNGGGLSDEEDLVDMEDLGAFVQVMTQSASRPFWLLYSLLRQFLSVL